MESAILAILLALLAAMLAYGLFLVARIVKAMRRLRALGAQRNYETIISAALPRASVDEVLRILPSGAPDRHLSAVLERMASTTDGELRQKVLELQRRLWMGEGGGGKEARGSSGGGD